jgi:hypothetical protein
MVRLRALTCSRLYQLTPTHARLSIVPWFYNTTYSGIPCGLPSFIKSVSECFLFEPHPAALAVSRSKNHERHEENKRAP